MKTALISVLLAGSALALIGCQQTEEEFPAVEDLGVDDGSSQDMPELEAAEAAKATSVTSQVTDEPTDDGGSQDDYEAAGQYYTDEPTDDGGSQDDYSAAGPPE